MIHYTAEEGKVYDKLVFPNGDKYAQYFPLEGGVGTSYYYQAKMVDFSENEDEPDKISLTYIKFLLDGGRIKSSSVNADLPKYEAFEGVQTKANNSLQKPEIAPTKTKLVGVGSNGQENIEIGDNLTLANGKLSATGVGSGGEQISVIQIGKWYPVEEISNLFSKLLAIGNTYAVWGGEAITTVPQLYISGNGDLEIGFYEGTFEPNEDGTQARITLTEERYPIYSYKYYYHFVTMTNSTDNVVLYLTIQNTNEISFTVDDLDNYLRFHKVLVNGNLHGAVPTYIESDGSGKIKIHYMNPGDSNINPTPDEYQDLSSFTINDLVTPVK